MTHFLHIPMQGQKGSCNHRKMHKNISAGRQNSTLKCWLQKHECQSVHVGVSCGLAQEGALDELWKYLHVVYLT